MIGGSGHRGKAQDLEAILVEIAPPRRSTERARIRLHRHSEPTDEMRFMEEPEPTTTWADRATVLQPAQDLAAFLAKVE